MTIDSLTSDGYFTTQVLDGARIAETLAFFEEHRATVPSSELVTGVTGVHSERASAQRVDTWLRAHLSDAIGEHLPGHRAFFGAFFLKEPGGPPMEFHQDWTYTDERHHRAVITWTPLVDVDEDNGAMRVVPGSHRWSAGIRPSNIDESPPTDPHVGAFADRARTVPMRAGEAIYFDPALVHGTPSNQTARVRPVVGMAFVPTDAQLLHFRMSEDGSLEGWEIDEHDFFMDAYHRRNAGFRPRTPWTSGVSADEFSPWLAPSMDIAERSIRSALGRAVRAPWRR